MTSKDIENETICAYAKPHILESLSQELHEIFDDQASMKEMVFIIMAKSM